jgi:uncharacterized protein (TIGR00369 family)
MSWEKHYRKLESMYQNAPVNKATAPDLMVAAGRAEVSMKVDESQFHAAGGVHGSFYFKLLDDAAFFAANSVILEHFVLTASFSVQLIRPVSSGILRAQGEVVRSGKNIVFASSELYDGDGYVVATGSGVFTRSKMELSDEVGYRLE